METAHRDKAEDKPRMPLKNVVVVFDGDCTHVNDIINMLVNPKKVKVGRAKISAIGFADTLQVRRILDVLNDSETLPQ